MYLKLDEFYFYDRLFEAKNLLLQEFSNNIEKITQNHVSEIIQFKDARLELSLEDQRIEMELDQIPAFLQDEYHYSNIIEYNKYAESLQMLDFNRPPKSFAVPDEIGKCELFLIAKMIEKAILLTFNLNKFSEFQFYTTKGTFLGTLSRIRLNRDLTGIFTNYDCSIFSERFKIEKKHIILLKDSLEIIDKEDYCLNNLPEILEELEAFTYSPYIEADKIYKLEELYKNRVKIPKRPIFYRVPFLLWEQQKKNFYVAAENISEIIY